MALHRKFVGLNMRELIDEVFLGDLPSRHTLLSSELSNNEVV